MFVRIVKESFVRKRLRKLIAVAAVALGASVATAMLSVMLGIGDKVNRELRSYGANIEVLPGKRGSAVTVSGIRYQAKADAHYIVEDELKRLKSIFWAHNILDFAPFLSIRAELSPQSTQTALSQTKLIGTWFEREIITDEGKSFRTGIRNVSPWWKVQGDWPAESECLVGVSLAARNNIRLGDRINIVFRPDGGSDRSTTLTVLGLLSTGDQEDDAVVADLAVVQRLASLEGKVERVEVSALTNPEDSFALSDPARLSPEDYERWICTPYARSIAHDIAKALSGAEARPVMRISQTEGALLNKIEWMMLLVTLAASITSVLGVASTMMTSVIERRSEIGLLKAIGASNSGVAALFLVEASIIGLLGGLAGLGIGYLLAQVIAGTVFGSAIEMSSVVLPLVILVSVVIAYAGTVLPLRKALTFQPSLVLKGE
jgi:putative ABC transport system permease protein